MKKTSLIYFVLTLFVSLTGFVSAHTGDDNFSHHGLMGSGFMWLFGLIFMILIVVALVLLIIWLIKQIQGPRKRR